MGKDHRFTIKNAMNAKSVMNDTEDVDDEGERSRHGPQSERDLGQKMYGPIFQLVICYE